MAGERYRIVTITNKERHVSSVVLGWDEVREHIKAETLMHAARGWTIEIRQREDGPCLTAKKGNVTRLIYAQQFDPMEDTNV